MILVTWCVYSSQIHRDKVEGGGQGLEDGDRELVFKGTISVFRDKKCSADDGGGVCTTMWMYLMPLDCTLKNG